MVDLELLKKRGYSPEKYKSFFTSETPASGIKELKDLVSSREKEGVQRSIKNSRLWWAIDRAYDAPFRQVSYTLVEGILSKKLDDRRILQITKDWGLGHLLIPKRDSNGKTCCYPDGTPMQKLHLPTFFQILIPLVQSYLKIRWGKLFTDLNQNPLHKFDPLKLTLANLVKCEIVTDRIQLMSTQMGYPADLRQTIFQTLLYGFCLKFPMEDWYKETQTILEDGKEKEFVYKEGVRFAIPHPSRSFADLAHRPDTINSDTGCEYGGYWDAIRFGDMERNKKLWNTDKIAFSGSSWFNDLWSPYTELYPCALMFPDLTPAALAPTQREANLNYYGAHEKDKAVLQCSMVVKIRPKEFGLFDYDGPVWHRFMLAAGETVVHCVPLAYNPMVYYGYDADANREVNSSLGLELLPHQDHLGNLLSQYLYSVKKNLASATFYNTDILSDEDVANIESVGEELYRGFKFIPFSRTELNWKKQTEKEAFYNVVFPRHDTGMIAQAMSTMIGILERLLGFSSQEIGQPAAHEQSATEITTIHANQSIRLSFTNSFIEDGLYAEKNLLYDATMAYSSDEVFAEVGDLNDKRREALKEMGFKIENEPDGHTKAGVRGNKKGLRLEGFIRAAAGLERLNNSQVAIGMMQTFQVILSQQQLVAALGVPQIIDLFNKVMVYAGFDKDFRLKATSEGAPPEQAAAAQRQLQAMMVQVAEAVSTKVVNENLAKMADVMKQKVIQPIEDALGKIAEKLQASDQHDAMQDQAIGSITEKIAQIFQQAAQPPPMLPPNVIPQSQVLIPGQ